MSWKLKKDSFSKSVVYFADGNIRTFYSLDWVHQYSKTRDRELGFKRLRNQVAKWGRLADVVTFYDLETGAQLERYEQGIKTTI